MCSASRGQNSPQAGSGRPVRQPGASARDPVPGAWVTQEQPGGGGLQCQEPVVPFQQGVPRGPQAWPSAVPSDPWGAQFPASTFCSLTYPTRGLGAFDLWSSPWWVGGCLQGVIPTNGADVTACGPHPRAQTDGGRVPHLLPLLLGTQPSPFPTRPLAPLVHGPSLCPTARALVCTSLSRFQVPPCAFTCERPSRLGADRRDPRARHTPPFPHERENLGTTV